MSDHSFIAYIDESGSEGGTGKIGASEFLIVAAVIVRSTDAQCVTDVWDLARRHTKKSPTWDWKSFKDIASSQYKFLISQLISTLPIQIVSVFAHKPTLDTLGQFQRYGELYFYLSHLLLERISWVCRDQFERFPYGDGTAKVIFSERANLKMDTFSEYVRKIKLGEFTFRSQVSWDHVDLTNIHTRIHKNCDGLRIADFVASSFGSAVEYKTYEITDDRFIMQMRNNIFRSNGRMYNNGVKLFPPECEGELPMETRMRWLGLHPGL